MKIYCLNLQTRSDRWTQAEQEFQRCGFVVERFPAIQHDNKNRALNETVMAVMKKAGGDDLLLFEDDVMFETEKALFIFVEAVFYLPEDYLTLHLGANIIGTVNWKMPERYNKKLAKLHGCWQSHAVLYNKRCVKFIIENLSYEKSFDEWLRLNVIDRKSTRLN